MVDGSVVPGLLHAENALGFENLGTGLFLEVDGQLIEIGVLWDHLYYPDGRFEPFPHREVGRRIVLATEACRELTDEQLKAGVQAAESRP